MRSEGQSSPTRTGTAMTAPVTGARRGVCYGSGSRGGKTTLATDMAETSSGSSGSRSEKTLLHQTLTTGNRRATTGSSTVTAVAAAAAPSAWRGHLHSCSRAVDATAATGWWDCFARPYLGRDCSAGSRWHGYWCYGAMNSCKYHLLPRGCGGTGGATLPKG